MGSIIEHDAGDCQRHIQLVCDSWLQCRGKMLTMRQPTTERDHAHDIQTLYREISGGMAADLQGAAAHGVLDQEWLRTGY